jgi:hypothetical protein
MSSISPEIPKKNIQTDLDQPHMEILDTSTARVWQVMSGVTRAEYDALEVVLPYVKVGVAPGNMDGGYFTRSPRQDVDGPMEVRDLFGHTWVYCASPLGAPELVAGEKGPRKITVDKHHVVIYRAGRELNYLTLPDGSEYVHVIPGNEPLVLPEGWQLRSEQVEQERSIELPAPATVFFFPNGDSYQGPV